MLNGCMLDCGDGAKVLGRGYSATELQNAQTSTHSLHQSKTASEFYKWYDLLDAVISQNSKK